MNLKAIEQAAGLAQPIRHQLFIGGRFVDAASGETLPTLNPHDNSTIADVAMAGREDIDRAVAAAERAFPAWSRMAAADRGRILLKLADLVEANAEELARLESLDTGHPLRDSRGLDVPRTAACFRYFGGMADKFQGETIPVEAGFLNYTLREPVGVVGQVVPWNFPLMFTSWKMAPALAAGNCVVMKPAEITPLTPLPSTAAPGPSSTTRARPASPARASSCTSASPTSSSTASSRSRDPSASATRSTSRPRWARSRARSTATACSATWTSRVSR